MAGTDKAQAESELLAAQSNREKALNKSTAASNRHDAAINAQKNFTGDKNSQEYQDLVSAVFAAKTEANELSGAASLSYSKVEEAQAKVNAASQPKLPPQELVRPARPADETDRTGTTSPEQVVTSATQTGSSNIIDYTPIPNLLHNFASYTYNLSLHALSPEVHKELVDSTKAVGIRYTPSNVLIASGGKRNDTFIRNPEFNEDFYFEDFKMQTISGDTNRSRNSNAIDISFTIIEPYGVTLLNRLIVMANNLGSPNYIELPYLMQIDFFGHGDDGVPHKIPNVTKFIPLRMLSIKIKVTEKGAEYQVAAAPFNHQAFSDSVVHVPAQFEITSGTVGGFFANSDVNTVGSQSIKDIQAANKAKDENTRAKDEKKKYIEQAKKNKDDIRLPKEYENNIKFYDNTIKANREIIKNGKPINTKSFTAAYNAWFNDLVVTKKQATADTISFNIDPLIAGATITPPEIQPASHSPMKLLSEEDDTGDTPPPSTPPVQTVPELPVPLQRKKILEDAAKSAGMETEELAAFMAQCHYVTMVKSKGFESMEDHWHGTGQQAKYDTDPELIEKLGNTVEGDGRRYNARGFIRILGKQEYFIYNNITGIGIVNNPFLVTDAGYAARIAIKYWNTKTVNGLTLSELAQSGHFDIVSIGIDGINPKTNKPNNLAERERLYAQYLSTYAKEENVQAKGTPSAAGNTVSPNAEAGVINYPINVGKSVVDIISDVVRNSSYIRNQIKDPLYKQIADDPSGILKSEELKALNWFKIIPEITLGEYDYGANGFSKIITYHVIPHIIYNTVIPEAPQGKPKGSVKEYNYIFTGKNIDILNFDLEFDSTYFIARTAMTENASKTDQQTKTEVVSGPDASFGNSAIANLNKKFKEDRSMNPKIKHVGPSAGSQESRTLDPTSKITSDLLSSIISRSTELITVDLKIIGDPDFIKQDDLFFNPRYTEDLRVSHPTLYAAQRTENGSLLTDVGQIHVNLVFQTPSDYNEQGLAIPNGRYVTSTFSGMYKVISVDNEFGRGKFEQTLHLVRILDQPAEGAGTNDHNTKDDSSLSNRELPANDTKKTKVTTLTTGPKVNTEAATQVNGLTPPVASFALPPEPPILNSTVYGNEFNGQVWDKTTKKWVPLDSAISNSNKLKQDLVGAETYPIDSNEFRNPFE